MVRAVPTLALLLTLGCGRCGADLRVAGDHPYVRCLWLEPEEGRWESGGLSFAVEDRGLAITGAVPSVLVFALTPGADLDALPDARLRLVLGGFARDRSSARRLLAALAEEGPTLLLPGGEDDAAILDEALSEVESPALVDLRGIHLLSFGGHEWVPVPGAPDGRYARGDGACGFSAADLAELDLDEAKHPRHLLSWATPSAAGPLAQGLDGVGVGVEPLGALADRVGAEGGLSAWPRRGAAAEHRTAGGLAYVSIPVWGRVVEGPDGSWSDGGVAVIELEGGAFRLAR